MKRTIGIQLYSLREYSKTRQDFIETIKRVAKIGYKIVEPAGLHDIPAKEFRSILDDLGLEMVSTHSPWAHTPADCQKIIDELGDLRLTNCVCGYGPNDFSDLDTIKRTADNTNAMLEIFSKAGITLFQHNHAFEFDRIGGELKYDIYLRMVPGVKLELDAYWTNNFGAESPVEMVKKFRDRMVLLHLKDGPFRQDANEQTYKNGILDRKITLCPLGQGDMEIERLLEETPDSIKEVIVEHDYSNKEMWQTVTESYEYMTKNGFCVGTV